MEQQQDPLITVLRSLAAIEGKLEALEGKVDGMEIKMGGRLAALESTQLDGKIKSFRSSSHEGEESALSTLGSSLALGITHMAQKPRYMLERTKKFDSEDRCVLERLGDALNDMLSFLPPRSLSCLDAAMTNREGREAYWLPTVQRLGVAGLVMAKMKECSNLLAALKWLIARGIAMPEVLKLGRSKFLNPLANEILACLANCKATSLACVRRVDLSQCLDVSAAGLSQLVPCVNFTHLDLSMDRDSESTMDNVWQELHQKKWSCFKTLQSVNVTGTGLTAAGGVSILLTNCPGLTETRGIDGGNNETLEQLGALRGLEVIEMDNWCTTVQGLALLKKLPKLRILELNMCEDVDAALNDLATSSFIRELRFSSSFRLSAAGSALFAGEAFAQLTKLSLHHVSGLTAQSLVHIGCLVNLQSLDLRGSRVGAGNNGGVSMMHHLGGLTQLRELDLSSCNINDADLDGLHGLTSLEKINLILCSVTQAGVERLVNACEALKDAQIFLCLGMSLRFQSSLSKRLSGRK